MLISRRTFVQSLLAFACCGAAPSAFAKTLETHTSSTLSQLLVTGSENSACVIDLKTGAMLHKVALGFPPHAFMQSPLAPHKVWMVQRYTLDIFSNKPLSNEKTLFTTAELDLKEGKVTNNIHAQLGCEYRGHGFFAPDGRTLFVTRMDMENAEGFLTGYDTTSQDSKVLAEIALGKTGLHECRLGADTETAYVACTGLVKLNPYSNESSSKRYSHGGIVQVHLSTGKVLSRMNITDDNYRIGHFHILKNGHVLATTSTDQSSKKNGLVFWGHVDEKTLSKIEMPENDKNPWSEKFDIAVHEKNHIAAVSDNVLKEIYIIDTQTGKYIDKVSYDTFGVTYDPYHDAFVVNGQQITMLDQHLARLTSGQQNYARLNGPFKSGHALII